MEAALTKLRAILQRIDGFRGFSTGWAVGDSDVGGEFGVAVGNWIREGSLMLGAPSTAVTEDREVFRDRFGIRSGG